MTRGNRRVPNGEQVRSVTGLALKRGKVSGISLATGNGMSGWKANPASESKPKTRFLLFYRVSPMT
jgi:hypothetical protein